MSVPTGIPAVGHLAANAAALQRAWRIRLLTAVSAHLDVSAAGAICFLC